jgi:nicotinamide-nucleotide amidase
MNNPSRLTAAVLTIGDELTTGYRLDTNSRTLSRRLSTVPLDVTLHLSVGDVVSEIHHALDCAFEAADVLLVTGGLGPTADDLTRQAIASYFDRPLVEDEQALAQIRERFARYGRTMPDSNRIQAHVPAGSQVIYNDRGTAPGFYIQRQGAHLFTTPGIPYEMDGMLDRFILPRLRELVGGGRVVRRADLKIYGLPESEINDRLRPLMDRGRNPLLGLLPHRGTITVELVATAETEAQAEALLADDLDRLEQKLGPYILGQKRLPQAVGDLLSERDLTIATWELGTGGLVAARLTEPPEAGRWFRGGRVVTEDALEQLTPPVDDTPALWLAAQARRKSGADLGIGTGPINIPDDSAPDQPYGLVHVAVDLQGWPASHRLSLSGPPAHVRQWAADRALALLRTVVLNAASEPTR